MSIERLDLPEVRKRYGLPHQLPLAADMGTRQSAMHPLEQQLVVSLASVWLPARVLEIGVSEGVLARTLLTRLACIRHYVGVDVPASYAAPEFVPRNTTDVHLRAQFAMTDPRFVLYLAVGGTEAIDAALLPHPVDVCIVDADHRYEGITRDTALACGVVRSGGVVMWHDYDAEHVGVRRFLDDRAAAGHKLFVHRCVAWEHLT